MQAQEARHTVVCPFCGEATIHHAKQRFYKCPGCGCEIWPEEESERRMIREAYFEDTKRGWKRGGSKKRSKRFGKKKTVKPLWAERYTLS